MQIIPPELQLLKPWTIERVKYPIISPDEPLFKSFDNMSDVLVDGLRINVLSRDGISKLANQISRLNDYSSDKINMVKNYLEKCTFGLKCNMPNKVYISAISRLLHGYCQPSKSTPSHSENKYVVHIYHPMGYNIDRKKYYSCYFKNVLFDTLADAKKEFDEIHFSDSMFELLKYAKFYNYIASLECDEFYFKKIDSYKLKNNYVINTKYGEINMCDSPCVYIAGMIANLLCPLKRFFYEMLETIPKEVDLISFDEIKLLDTEKY